jgi:hypothetical protein
MAKRRHPTKASSNFAAISTARAVTRSSDAAPSEPDDLIPATRIRKLCGGISPMTLWRWRRSATLGCPPLTEINGRLYGGERAWLAWRENQRQQQAA